MERMAAKKRTFPIIERFLTRWRTAVPGVVVMLMDKAVCVRVLKMFSNLIAVANRQSS
jgi:hypothetical protein